MQQISQAIGGRIRTLRKSQGLTLQQLSEKIHKSRASLSKYEAGEIVLDVETLYEISKALDVDIRQLLDACPRKIATTPLPDNTEQSPFFQATELYFYFYDGRCRRLKGGVIHIDAEPQCENCYGASLAVGELGGSGHGREVFYKGSVAYSGMLIRVSFANQFTTFAEDLIYIYTPLDYRNTTEGLLCGISSMGYFPCAYKCLVSLTPLEPNDDLKQQLLSSSQDWKRWQSLNMLIMDNHN